jgi:hypothetical protein
MTTVDFTIQELSLPDPLKFARSLKDVRQLSRVELGPSLAFMEEQVGELASQMKETYSAFYRQCASTRSSLRYLNLHDIASLWTDAANDSGRTAQQLAEYRAALMVQACDAVVRCTEAAHADVVILEKGLRGIRDIHRPAHNTTQQLMQKEIDIAAQRVTNAQALCRNKELAVGDVQAGLDVFKRFDLEKIFHAVMPSAEEVEGAIRSMVTQKPDPALIKGAIARIERHVSAAGEARAFKALALTLDALRHEAAEAKLALKNAEASMALQNQQFENLVKAQGAWSAAAIWAEEVDKIVVVYQAFLALHLDARCTDIAAFTQIEQQAARMEKYIQQLPTD